MCCVILACVCMCTYVCAYACMCLVCVLFLTFAVCVYHTQRPHHIIIVCHCLAYTMCARRERDVEGEIQCYATTQRCNKAQHHNTQHTTTQQHTDEAHNTTTHNNTQQQTQRHESSITHPCLIAHPLHALMSSYARCVCVRVHVVFCNGVAVLHTYVYPALVR